MMDSNAVPCSCGVYMAAEASFCPACGRPRQSSRLPQCIHCGADIPAGQEFCGLCGRARSEPEQPPSPGGHVAKWPLGLAVGVVTLAVTGAGWYAFHAAPRGAAPADIYLVGNDPGVVAPPQAPADANAPDKEPVSPYIGPPPVRQTRSKRSVSVSETTPARSEPVAPSPVQVTEQPVSRVEPPPVATAPAQPVISSLPVRPPVPEADREPPPTAVLSVPPAPRRAEPLTREGEVIWSGVLEKNQVVTIDSSVANSGRLRGALPGAPVLISVMPQDIGIVEMPGPSNGWRRLALRSRSKRNSVVTIHWSLLQ